MITIKEKNAKSVPVNGTGESVARSKHWYVIYVRMHHERKVSERLGQMGIDSFVPV